MGRVTPSIVRTLGTLGMVAGLCAASPASAQSWEAGALQPLPVPPDLSAIHSAGAGAFNGTSGFVVAGPEGVALMGSDGAIRAVSEPDQTGTIADMTVEDLDGDGSLEIVVCTDAGVKSLRVIEPEDGPGRFAEPNVLTDQACAEVVGLPGVGTYGSLVTRTDAGEVTIWTPGPDGMQTQLFAGADAVALTSTTGRFAARMADGSVKTGPEPADLEVEEGLAAIAADGDGWALAYGGDEARLVLADGTLVPLPAAPVSMERVDLGAGEMPDLLVRLDDGGLALRLDDGAPGVVSSLREAGFDTASSAVVAVGDLDDDGCSELLGFAADASEALRIGGTCNGAATAGLTRPDNAAPPPGRAGQLTLGERWAQLTATEGQLMELQLVDGVNGWTRFAARGGPDGFSLTSSGTLSFKPVAKQVGLWRVAVLVSDGEEERWTGIVLRVEAAPEGSKLPESGDKPLAVAVDDPATDLDGDPDDDGLVSRADSDVVLEPREIKDPTFFTMRECLVGVGVAAGVSKNAQSSWSNVGLPDAVPSASPAVTMVCAGGAEKVRWFIGADSAPTFFYLARNGRQNHVLAGTLGVEWAPGKFRIGPYVNAGLVVLGFGLRTVVVPFETKQGNVHGLELRLTAYPTNLSGQGILAYTWEFGNF